MKKKILCIILIIAIVFVCVFIFARNSNNDNEETLEESYNGAETVIKNAVLAINDRDSDAFCNLIDFNAYMAREDNSESEMKAEFEDKLLNGMFDLNYTYYKAGNIELMENDEEAIKNFGYVDKETFLQAVESMNKELKEENEFFSDYTLVYYTVEIDTDMKEFENFSNEYGNLKKDVMYVLEKDGEYSIMPTSTFISFLFMSFKQNSNVE